MKHNYMILGNEPVNVVIEMGLGACLSEWIPLVKLLSKDYGVLVYERAGINKSQPSPKERTPLNIANELFELLKSINHAQKIVIVAHSQGGLYAQQFCRLYPEMIKGLVLLDPLSAHDNKFKECLSEEEYKKSGVDKSSNFKMMYTLAKLKLGFISKMILKKAPPMYYYNGYAAEEVNEILESAKSPIHAKTALEEYQKAHECKNIEHLSGSEDFPNISLILITHSSALAIEESMKFGSNTREFASSIEDMWQSIMKEYLKFTSKSFWIQATNSTHYIHLTEPELVINAVKKVFH